MIATVSIHKDSAFVKMSFSLTMSAITAMVRTNMAAMAHVFRAHRVRSIHIEKETNLLENICNKQTINNTTNKSRNGKILNRFFFVSLKHKKINRLVVKNDS